MKFLLVVLLNKLGSMLPTDHPNGQIRACNTKPKNRMTRLSLIALFLVSPSLLAGMSGHSRPSRAVENAKDIAVGIVHVSRDHGLRVHFTPQTVLKGHMQPGSAYVVDYTDERDKLSYPSVLPQIAAASEGRSAVMLLGRLQPDGRTLTPNSLEGALWPRSTQKYAPLKTPETLEKCITFVKALLINPKLKLKDVDGRQVLPDDYIPPVASSSPPQPDDDTRVMAYLSPSKAVESARDIAAGTLQVSRENGLELRFTPTSVFKGGMQPGKTYAVDYPHERLYFRDYLPQIASAAEGRPAVMLLGRLHSDGKTFEPEGLDSAVWPRSAKWGGVFQTPDTLEECITFVKALVANPDLKLKIANDRQMLPDGYKQPPSSPETIKPAETPPAAPKVQ